MFYVAIAVGLMLWISEANHPTEQELRIPKSTVTLKTKPVSRVSRPPVHTIGELKKYEGLPEVELVLEKKLRDNKAYGVDALPEVERK